MWRAFFLAAGGILMFTGVEALVLDHAVLSADGPLAARVTSTEPVLDEYGFEVERAAVATPVGRTIKPPEWAPWSLLSTGAIVFLYALMGGSRGE